MTSKEDVEVILSHMKAFSSAMEQICKIYDATKKINISSLITAIAKAKCGFPNDVSFNEVSKFFTKEENEQNSEEFDRCIHYLEMASKFYKVICDKFGVEKMGVLSNGWVIIG